MRMQDKVLQLVVSGIHIVNAQAIIKNVWLRAGTMYGKYGRQAVVCTSRGVWAFA